VRTLLRAVNVVLKYKLTLQNKHTHNGKTSTVKPQIVQILAAGHAGREQRLHLLQLHRAGHDKPVKYTSLLKMRFKKVKRNSNNSTHNSICKTNLNHVAPLVDSRHLILEDIVFYYHFMSCKLPKLPTCADDTSSIAACSRGR
jgi:hypothetical protein